MNDEMKQEAPFAQIVISLDSLDLSNVLRELQSAYQAIERWETETSELTATQYRQVNRGLKRLKAFIKINDVHELVEGS